MVDRVFINNINYIKKILNSFNKLTDSKESYQSARISKVDQDMKEDFD